MDGSRAMGCSSPPPKSFTDIVLWILQNGIKSLTSLVAEIVRLASKGVYALAEYLYHNRQALLALPLRILIVLKQIINALGDNPVTRAVGRLLSNLIFFKISLDKTIGKGPNGKPGIHTTLCTCFSLLFGMLQLDSEYRFFLGSPFPSRVADAPQPAPILYDPLAPPTPLRDFKPTAATPDTEEVHLLCSSDIKDHIMRFLYTQSHTTGGKFLLLNSSNYSIDGNSTARRPSTSDFASRTAQYLQQTHWATSSCTDSSIPPEASQLTSPIPSEPIPVPPAITALQDTSAQQALFSDDELAQHAAAPAGETSLLSVIAALPGYPQQATHSTTTIDPAAAIATAAAATATSAALSASPPPTTAAAVAAAAFLNAPPTLPPLDLPSPTPAAASPSSISPSGSNTSRSAGRPPLPFATPTSARRLMHYSSTGSSSLEQGCSSSSPSAAAAGVLGLKGLLSDDAEAAAMAGSGSGLMPAVPIPWMSPKRVMSGAARGVRDVTVTGCDSLSEAAGDSS